MKCEKCNHEQASGKFCGKCGTPLQEVETGAVEEVTGAQSELEVAATVESVQPLQPTANPVVATPAQPNEQVERVKDTSKKYVAYIKEFAVNPSRIFSNSENQFTNAIITMAIILLLASYTIFLAIKSFYTMATESFAGNIFGDDIGGFLESQVPKLSLFPTYGNVFMILLFVLGLSVAVSLVVLKIAKQLIDFKRLISIYGTLLIPVVGVVVLSFLFVLINKVGLGLALLILGFSLAVYLYPLRIVLHQFIGESKIDATHRGLIYFAGFSVILYIIITQYVTGKLADLSGLLNYLDLFEGIL